MRERESKATFWSALLVVLGIACILTPAIVLAAGGSGQGFDAIVRSIEVRYHAHATRIPFMGLISGIAGISTHGGVRGLHVAEFEHFRAGDEPDLNFDGAEFNALVEEHVGHGWQRMIRETGRGKEQTLIYVRQEGEHMGMLVVDLSGNDLDVVQLSVNPEHLMDEVSKHRHEHGRDHNADKDEDRDDLE
jgi:hypothetical protein